MSTYARTLLGGLASLLLVSGCSGEVPTAVQGPEETAGPVLASADGESIRITLTCMGGDRIGVIGAEANVRWQDGTIATLGCWAPHATFGRPTRETVEVPFVEGEWAATISIDEVTDTRPHCTFEGSGVPAGGLVCRLDDTDFPDWALPPSLDHGGAVLRMEAR